MAPLNVPLRDGRAFGLLVLVLALAAALRFTSLGGDFVSEDDVRQTWRVIHNPGYAWVIDWPTGILGPLVQKIAIAAVSAIGLYATEFWWRVPSALTGMAHLVLVFGFALRLGFHVSTAVATCAVLAVLPVHVANSRYTWGHEITGAFCLAVALWALHVFYERPAWRSAVVASLGAALYLVSHHFIVPFFACALLISLASSSADEVSVPRRLWQAATLLLRYGVWIVPLISARLYTSSFGMVGQRHPHFAMYLDTQIPLFVEAVGLFVAGGLAIVIVGALVVQRDRSRTFLALAMCGLAYLAPLFLAVSPAVTNVKGYMMIGVVLLVLAAGAAVDPCVGARPATSLAVITSVICLTLWGTVTNVFATRFGSYPDYSFAKVEWGRALTRPGHSTAGYLVRKYLPSDRSYYLAMDICQWPARYYFGQEGCALPEVNWPVREVYAGHPCVGTVDVIVCDALHRPWVAGLERFEQKLEILSEGHPVAWIYATPEVSFPVSSVRVEDVDPEFDAEFSARISISR